MTKFFITLFAIVLPASMALAADNPCADALTQACSGKVVTQNMLNTCITRLNACAKNIDDTSKNKAREFSENFSSTQRKQERQLSRALRPSRAPGTTTAPGPRSAPPTSSPQPTLPQIRYD